MRRRNPNSLTSSCTSMSAPYHFSWPKTVFVLLCSLAPAPSRRYATRRQYNKILKPLERRKRIKYGLLTQLPRVAISGVSLRIPRQVFFSLHGTRVGGKTIKQLLHSRRSPMSWPGMRLLSRILNSTNEIVCAAGIKGLFSSFQLIFVVCQLVFVCVVWSHYSTLLLHSLREEYRV